MPIARPISSIPCNATALRKAARHVSLLYDDVLVPLGLRGTQRAILVHIGRLGAPSMGVLAAAMVLDRSALAHMLKPLATRGWVTILRNPQDGRERTVRLTKAGETLLAKTAPLWQGAQDRFEQALGPHKAAALREMLAEVTSLDLSAPTP